VIELYQAEWCAHSHRVRERLTQLGVDYVARQVETEPDDRTQLQELSGQTGIPVLVAEGTVLSDEDEIIAWLDERFGPARAA
jgi:glutaredoxin 3